MMIHDYLTIAHLSDLLHISETTQWRMRRDGKLPYFVVGHSIRYRREEVLAIFGAL